MLWWLKEVHGVSHKAGGGTSAQFKKSTFLVVFLDIWYPAVAKKIIDTEIYDKTFNYFVEQVLEVDWKISQKQPPSACAIEAPLANYTNQEHHQDDAEEDFDSDDDVIVETPVHENDDDQLAR